MPLAIKSSRLPSASRSSSKAGYQSSMQLNLDTMFINAAITVRQTQNIAEQPIKVSPKSGYSH